MKKLILLTSLFIILSCNTAVKKVPSIYLHNQTNLDFNIKNCDEYLHLKTRNKELKRFTRLSLLNYLNDTITFNIEVFRIDQLNDTLRIGNFGITKYKYSEAKIQETLCKFLNK